MESVIVIVTVGALIVGLAVIVRAWLCDTMPPHWVARHERDHQTLTPDEPSRIDIIKKIAAAEHRRHQ